MNEQNEKTNVINVFGLANIGCTMENVTFQTMVQDKANKPNEEETLDKPMKEEVHEEETGNNETLFVGKKAIVDRMLHWADKGDWRQDDAAEKVKTMLMTMLGLNDEVELTSKQAALSAKLWQLLENGRGDRVKIVWQNIVGYLADKNYFKLKGTPALNFDFFGNEDGYTNIDKGRPSRNNMSAGFREILPLLDDFVPKG